MAYLIHTLYFQDGWAHHIDFIHPDAVDYNTSFPIILWQTEVPEMLQEKYEEAFFPCYK